MTPCPGLLELLHPDGAAPRSVVLGSACPDRLRPSGVEGEPPWDLAVVAPSPQEARSPTWRGDTTALIATSLRDDGLAYVLAPAGPRRAIRRDLALAGLRATDALLHLPGFATTELMLVLESGAFGTAIERLRVPGSARTAALRLAASAPGALRILAWGHPSVGLVARRSGGRPLGQWLTAPDGRTSLAFLRVGWRHDRARAIAHWRGNAGGAGAVAKVMLRSADARADIRREALALDSLSAAARKAGASVPTGRVMEFDGRCPALVLEALPGTSAAAILTEQPTAYEGIVRRLGAWLEAWSRATCRSRPLDQALLDGWVLQPARRLADRLEDGAAYATWLEGRCGELVGRPVPLVATHNDLTMSNVLLQPDGRLGILDWEAATAEGLPLRDFVYAVVDATAARDGYRDRPGALSRCFGDGAQGVVAEVLRRLRRAIGVPDAFATVVFHACWLQHAEDEARKRAPGEPLPFLECVQRAMRIRDLT